MMLRRPSLLGACLLVTILAWITSCMATAQGPVYRERWGYLHLENRRAQVFDELAGRSSADVAKVAALLVGPDHGVPFAPVAEALAFLRGVAVDDAFLLRCSLGLYVLPEVVDPETSVVPCRQGNFTVFLPFSMPASGAMTFEMVVRDALGETVWSHLIERKTDMKSVRMAQTKISVPCVDLADGAYEIEMRALFDGEPPRDHDPDLHWTFYVLRGYQARADAALATASALRVDLQPLLRAQLDGMATPVLRAYTGQAFAVRSDAVRELVRLETCLENLAANRAPLVGLPGGGSSDVGLLGVVATAMPAGDITQPCLLRMPIDANAHPLVVFVSGSPAYDVGSSRPSAPAMREASWLARELGDFGVDEQWHVAYFDSPGGGRPFAKALLSSLVALPEVLATGPHKPLLVCEREAAAVVAMQLHKFRPHISGIVLLGAGAMPKAVLEQLGDLPVRTVSLSGYPGTRALERMMDFVEAQKQAAHVVVDIARLHDRQVPWLFGAARSRVEIRAFAKQVFGDG